jgi:hypothetical protein
MSGKHSASSSSSATTLAGQPTSHFRKEFANILQRWAEGRVTQADKEYMDRFTFSDDEFEGLQEDTGVKCKFELYKNKIILDEFASPVQEYMNRRVERLVDRAYGDALHRLGSATISFIS